MNRDEVLSLLAGTEPNKVSWNFDFVFKILTYAGLPLLVVVSAQFPEIGRAILSVVGPIFHGAH